MKFLSCLFSAAFLFVLSSSAFAQTGTIPSGSGTGSGDISGRSSAPAGLKDARFFKFMLRRLHTIEVDNIVARMKEKGIQKAQYIAGFNVKGALLYNHELMGNKIDNMDATGRNVGMQLFPYEINILSNGAVRFNVSGFSFKNMNSYVAEHGCEFCDGDGGDDFFANVDNLSFLSFTMDHNVKFKNVRSYDVRMFEFEPKVLLGSIGDINTKGVYFALKANTSIGFGRDEVTREDGTTFVYGVIPSDYDNEVMIDSKDPNKVTSEYGFNSSVGNGSGMGFRSNVGGGFEMVYQGPKGGKIHLGSTVQGAFSVGGVGRPENVAANVEMKNQYLAARKQYDADVAMIESMRAQYESANGYPTGSLSLETYTNITGTQSPVAPSAPQWRKAYDDVSRVAGYWVSTLEYSHSLPSKGRPVRMGVRASYTLPITDDFDGMDMTEQFRLIGTGSLFLNF